MVVGAEDVDDELSVEAGVNCLDALKHLLPIRRFQPVHEQKYPAVMVLRVQYITLGWEGWGMVRAVILPMPSHSDRASFIHRKSVRCFGNSKQLH